MDSELLSPYSDKKSAGNFGNLTVLLGNDDPAGLFFCRFLAISTQASSIIPRKSFTMINSCNGGHVLSFEDPRWKYSVVFFTISITLSFSSLTASISSSAALRNRRISAANPPPSSQHSAARFPISDALDDSAECAAEREWRVISEPNLDLRNIALKRWKAEGNCLRMKNRKDSASANRVGGPWNPRMSDCSDLVRANLMSFSRVFVSRPTPLMEIWEGGPAISLGVLAGVVSEKAAEMESLELLEQTTAAEKPLLDFLLLPKPDAESCRSKLSFPSPPSSFLQYKTSNPSSSTITALRFPSNLKNSSLLAPAGLFSFPPQTAATAAAETVAPPSFSLLLLKYQRTKKKKRADRTTVLAAVTPMAVPTAFLDGVGGSGRNNGGGRCGNNSGFAGGGGGSTRRLMGMRGAWRGGKKKGILVGEAGATGEGGEDELVEGDDDEENVLGDDGEEVEGGEGVAERSVDVGDGESERHEERSIDVVGDGESERDGADDDDVSSDISGVSNGLFVPPSSP
nr:hypothetical protein Iba_chr08eCG10500 [Ipomoea batatas]